MASRERAARYPHRARRDATRVASRPRGVPDPNRPPPTGGDGLAGRLTSAFGRGLVEAGGRMSSAVGGLARRGAEVGGDVAGDLRGMARRGAGAVGRFVDDVGEGFDALRHRSRATREFNRQLQENPDPDTERLIRMHRRRLRGHLNEER